MERKREDDDRDYTQWRCWRYKELPDKERGGRGKERKKVGRDVRGARKAKRELYKPEGKSDFIQESGTSKAKGRRWGVGPKSGSGFFFDQKTCSPLVTIVDILA